MNTLKEPNFTAKHFVCIVPISRRTFSEIKRDFGQKVLKDVAEVFKKDVPLRVKKRLFYDDFEVLNENLKDIIWETYIRKIMGIEDEE